MTFSESIVQYMYLATIDHDVQIVAKVTANGQPIMTGRSVAKCYTKFTSHKPRMREH